MWVLHFVQDDMVVQDDMKVQDGKWLRLRMTGGQDDIYLLNKVTTIDAGLHGMLSNVV